MDHNRKFLKLKKKIEQPRISASWSELPQELLQSIATRLSTQGQIRQFRSVCKTWRQSVPPPPPTTALFSHPPLKLSFSDDMSNYNLRSQSGSLVVFSVCLLRPNDKPTKVSPWMATVEEPSPGKALLRKPLCRTLIKHLPRYVPSVLDLSQFHVTEVFKGYYIRLDDDLKRMFREWNFWDFKIHKVVLFVNPNSSASNNDSTVLILDSSRSLHAARLGGGEKLEWVSVPILGPPLSRSGARKKIMRGRPRWQSLMVDDMVSFMGEVYAIDRGGWVYAISYEGLTVRTVVDEVPESLFGAGNRKKWLVEWSGQLYMVRRCAGAEVKFEVYEVDLELRCWNLMESLGDDRILFVSFDGCFFLSVGVDLPPCGFRGNLIIFYRGCFYSSGHTSEDEPDGNIFGYRRRNIYEYRRRNTTGDECDVAVYDYMMPSNCSPVMCWSKYDSLLWPPPRWLAPDASSSSGSSEEDEEFERDSHNEYSQLNHEESESDSHNEHSQLNRKESETDSHNEHSLLNHVASRKSNSYAETEDEEQRAENHPMSTQEQSANDEECVHQEATDGQPEQQNDTPEASTTVTETFRTYKGLNIKADVVPTLQKIWAKHGNITERSAVHNGDILARALESLARVVETLQSSSGWSLEDGQADYMSSLLLDLKHMQINVDWLSPSVEKALALNRSKASIKTLAEIDKAKAEAQELRMKLLDELAKVEEKENLLEEERARVSRTISISGEIDMDGCLGDGLC